MAIWSADKAKSLIANRFCKNHRKQGEHICWNCFLNTETPLLMVIVIYLAPTLKCQHSELPGLEVLATIFLQVSTVILEKNKTRSSTDPS